MVEIHGEPGATDVVVFLQTIEHVLDPVAVLGTVRSLLAAGGTAYVSTRTCSRSRRQALTKSANPWHIREYRAARVARRCATLLADVSSCSALFRARGSRAPRPRARARLGLGPLPLGSPALTDSRPRSRPATSRCGPTGSTARWTFLAVCRT